MNFKFETENESNIETLSAAFSGIIPEGVKIASFKTENHDYTAIFVPKSFKALPEGESQGWFDYYFNELGPLTAAGFGEDVERTEEFKPGLYFFITADYGPCQVASVATFIPNSENFTEEEIQRVSKIVHEANEYIQADGDFWRYEEMMKEIGVPVEFTAA